MAIFKEKQFLIEETEATNPYFDGDHQPGETAGQPGIYRCMGCGREIAIAEGHTLPTQHGAGSHTIRWRLVVYADHRSDADHASSKGSLAEMFR
jgi:hypothetical protein